MVKCNEAPAARALLREASAKWPHRRTSSDGVCARAEHTTANPGSHHEPWLLLLGRWWATAVDLSDDKANGCDADALAEALRVRRDPRVLYVISNRRMYSSYPARGYPAWTWRPYTGSNPHETHTHISLTEEAVFSTAPWWPDPTPPEDDEMDRTCVPSWERRQANGRVGFFAVHDAPDLGPNGVRILAMNGARGLVRTDGSVFGVPLMNIAGLAGKVLGVEEVHPEEADGDDPTVTVDLCCADGGTVTVARRP